MLSDVRNSSRFPVWPAAPLILNAAVPADVLIRSNFADGVLVPIPTLPLLVLFMIWLPSGVVHCAFTVAGDVGGARFHRPGTLIGKALEPLRSGSGKILVLLSLQ